MTFQQPLLTSETTTPFFGEKIIRRQRFNDERRFSIEDIVAILTESNDPKQYINKMRARDNELKQGWVQIVHTLEMQTKGGLQKINCVNTQLEPFVLFSLFLHPKLNPSNNDWLL
ncbi:MAG: hypothetical protein LBU27_06690 [Candidatus Peribacteria bacterium]|nr:hypothetical protein [Candidatus Peribacteria bacterium]